MSKNKKKMIKFVPHSDSRGRYVPFCDFTFHRGIIKNHSLCEQRQCSHYCKLYISTSYNDAHGCVRGNGSSTLEYESQKREEANQKRA